MTDLRALYPGALQRGFGGDCTEFNRRGSRKRATKGSDRGARTAKDYDIAHDSSFIEC